MLISNEKLTSDLKQNITKAINTLKLYVINSVFNPCEYNVKFVN